DNGATTVAVRYAMRLRPFGRGYWLVAGAALLLYGLIGIAVRSLLGMSAASMILYLALASSLYSIFLWRFRSTLPLSAFRDFLRRRSATSAGGTAPDVTTL